MDNSIYGQLQVFQAIVSEGNISAAARKLGIAVPSASQSLKLLEQKIGVPLFTRSTRQIQLTEAGMQLLERTGSALATLQQAVDEVQQFGNSPSGLVRITLSRFAYQLILKPIFAEFCQLYPQVQLEISLNDATVDILQQGFDLGIRFGDTLEEGWIARQLVPPFREGLYASAGYLTQYSKPEKPEDLSAHKLIGYRFISANRIYPLKLNNQGQELEVQMPWQLMSNDIDVMNDAVREGLGIGRIFEPILQQQADRHEFIPVLEGYWQTYPAVYLYYLKHSQKAKRVQVLIEFLLEKARALFV